MPTTTTTYSFNKPVVGADEDDWGGYLNGNWDSVDDLLDGTTPVTGIDINSGTLDGVTIGGTTAGAGTFTNLTATGTTTLAGASTSADITFGDNDKAIFGAGSDLQIYHDGSNSFIDEAGTGNLRIRASSALSLQTRNTADTAWVNSIIADDGAGVRLFTNGSKKLETTSTGVDITGTLTSDGLTVSSSGTSNSLTLTKTDGNAVKLVAGNTEGTHTFEFNNGGVYLSDTTGLRLGLSSDGDISFYEDTGTTAKFFWDASAERLGIGTTSPSASLHVERSTDASIKVKNTVNNANSLNHIELYNNDETGSLLFGVGRSGAGGNATIKASQNLSISTGGTERMRIDSSGNLLVGTTTNDAWYTTTNEGHNLNSGNFLAVARDGGTSFVANRLGTDGDAYEVRKNGTIVGSIGSEGSGARLYINQGDTGIGMQSNIDSVIPVSSNGGARNNAIDLGYSTVRWKDLYLSGGVVETTTTVTYASSIALTYDNGSIQTVTLTGNVEFTDSLADGEAIVLMLNAGASYTVLWTAVDKWVSSSGNAAPTLTANDTIVLWKIGTTVYAAYAGSYT